MAASMGAWQLLVCSFHLPYAASVEAALPDGRGHHASSMGMQAKRTLCYSLLFQGVHDA